MYKSSFIHEFVIDSEWVSVYVHMSVCLCIYMYFQEINCIGQATQTGFRDHNSGVCVKWKCFLIESRFDTIPKWIWFDLYLVKGSQHDIRINDFWSYFCTSTDKNVSNSSTLLELQTSIWNKSFALNRALNVTRSLPIYRSLFVSATVCPYDVYVSLCHFTRPSNDILHSDDK